MTQPPLTAVILIVSTTASGDPGADQSASALREVLQPRREDTQTQTQPWEVVGTQIVPDDAVAIQRQLLQWTDGGSCSQGVAGANSGDRVVNLVLTAGGTGFAVGDLTPEAVGPLLHRQAPGLVHGMLAASLEITPFALMSRPVAGVRNKTLIITLPGSPKGARENLQAVIKLLPHACLQAAGADSRSLHAGGMKKLEAEAGVVSPEKKPGSRFQSHSHGFSTGCGRHHGPGHGDLVRHTPVSNDPSLGPSQRNRESPYPMISVEDALSKIKENIPKPQMVTVKVGLDLPGSILAEDAKAAENVPAFRASIVDGYAVVVPEDGNMRGLYPVVSGSHAAPTNGGEAAERRTLKKGQVARITTGAPLPPGATSVIMVEDTVLKTTMDNGKEEKEIEILADGVKEGENIREIGSDISIGSVIGRKGDRVSAVGGEIGLLAAVGITRVKTYKKPIIGVLSTGDEIVDHDYEQPSGRASQLGEGQVRDTNRITLLCAIKERGFQAIDLGIAPDTPGALEEKLRGAFRTHGVDVIITTGGVSMGELDLLKPTIERQLGGIVHFGRVNMKPGKPTTFATVPFGTHGQEEERVDRVVFGLPGNPASALVTFYLFVLPAIGWMSGAGVRSFTDDEKQTTEMASNEDRGPGLPEVSVKLAHEFTLDKSRPEYHRAVVAVDGQGVMKATSTGGQRSSRIGSLRAANALVCLPAGGGDRKILERGTLAKALLLSHVYS